MLKGLWGNRQSQRRAPVIDWEWVHGIECVNGSCMPKTTHEKQVAPRRDSPQVSKGLLQSPVKDQGENSAQEFLPPLGVRAQG